MSRVSLSTTTNAADDLIRDRFNVALCTFNRDTIYSSEHPITLENSIDNASPPLNYTFRDEYEFFDKNDEPDINFVTGCESCRPNMAHYMGCEYSRVCECLEDAAVDEQRLNETERKRYDKDLKLKRKNPDHMVNTTGLPKRFPYSKDLLVPFYLESRNVIYECNHLCKCGDNCRTKVTKYRRQVPLEIFKTEDRGWGLRCPVNLKKGQFIDFYYGLMIPVDESEKRLEAAGKEKVSYIFALDKYHDYVLDDETGEIVEETIHDFDVDGEFVGGPARFINHSCEPNCRQFVVSWNKNDLRRYNLALFALENIPAGKELTFDYIDLEEDEDDELRKEIKADSVKCRCGATKCRQYLWR
jgi:[histone H3]-lysine9 N-trimethyltransferase SUV39H